MTIIVAVRDAHKQETWIASDTMATQGDTLMYGASKWVVRKPWAAAIAGDYRAMNVLAAHADDIMSGLSGAYDFTLRMRGALIDDGFNSDQEDGPKGYGTDFILAHPGGVWAISQAFSIVEIPDNEVWADGSGRAYGLGAAHACNGSPKQKVQAAVKAAIRYSDGCGGEVRVQKLKT